MELKKGDFIRHKSNKLEGIVVGFKTSEFNKFYHKVVIHCTYAPVNRRLNGTTLWVNNHGDEWKIVNRGKENE
jgi:hypothetical protein